MKNQKDPELKGIFVRRCKCGDRPYYDRTYPGPPTRICWIACNCGQIGEGAFSKEECIENWNNNKMDITQYMY